MKNYLNLLSDIIDNGSADLEGIILALEDGEALSAMGYDDDDQDLVEELHAMCKSGEITSEVVEYDRYDEYDSNRAPTRCIETVWGTAGDINARKGEIEANNATIV